MDASGSMSNTDWKPSRQVAAHKPAVSFLKRLLSKQPDSIVAVVVYGDEATVLVGPTPVKRHDKIAKAINSISSMGCTNITAALEIACNIFKTTSCVNQAVLSTDGCHNTGPDPRPISGRLRKHAIVECVGIGGSPSDVDEDLLGYIASSYPDGSKRYRWIGHKERLVETFENLAGRIVRA
ncbi:MAG: VWA domain-containing protein [Planctomycetota bacterium]